jgi:hypothetical protein
MEGIENNLRQYVYFNTIGFTSLDDKYTKTIELLGQNIIKFKLILLSTIKSQLIIQIGFIQNIKNQLKSADNSII